MLSLLRAVSPKITCFMTAPEPGADAPGFFALEAKALEPTPPMP